MTTEMSIMLHFSLTHSLEVFGVGDVRRRFSYRDQNKAHILSTSARSFPQIRRLHDYSHLPACVGTSGQGLIVPVWRRNLEYYTLPCGASSVSTSNSIVWSITGKWLVSGKQKYMCTEKQIGSEILWYNSSREKNI